ncbi:MAG: ABC transporter ATP-binding protein [Candidatus Thorarchaeota archaeon]|jgi:ABC-2 type transport system ATP-binding protein
MSKVSQEYVIQTSGLTKNYGEVLALNSLDLVVPKNSIFAFLGPNGAGKTTTIKLLLGLTKPTAGNGSIFNLDIVNDNTSIRKRVGYLAQQPQFYKELSARETLRFAARFYYRGPKEKIEARVDKLIGLVGLEEKADRPVEGFSGGEMQRLGIAQAQINYPDLLVLDEPAAGLDPQGREEVLSIMEELRAETTIFYSTHILDDVQRVSDMAAILNKGTLIAQAPIGELLAGTDGIAYAVIIEGDASKSESRLLNENWISEITSQKKDGTTKWIVTVTDDSIAKKKLLQMILEDSNLSVTSFGLKHYELEEVFMRLVEDDKNE